MNTTQKHQYRNNNLIIITLSLFIAFLLVELIFRIHDLYRIFPSVDIISHFMSGMATTSLFYWLFSLNSRNEIKAILSTFMIAIIWEILEELEEMILPNLTYLKDYFFWDGVFDIIFMIIGGLVILTIFKKLNIK